MNISPTAEWLQLYDKFYRKRELYDMAWTQQAIDLTRFNVVGAPFGGAIALIRDEKKILLVNNQTLRPMFQIFTSSGREISSFLWNKGRIVGMDWTQEEKLICVLEDGTVVIYSLFGDILSQFSLGKDCVETGVLECKFWGNGLVALTGDYQFVAITNLYEPRPRKLAFPGLTVPPTSWAIIEPKFSISQGIEVLVATQSGTILLVDSLNVQDQLLTDGPFTKMSVSPNGRLLACFSETGTLYVLPVDFTQRLSKFDTKSRTPPEQMVWCGTDSVLLYWEGILLNIGPYSDWLKYTYEEPILLIPECDGVRIVSNTKCEFLQKVPDVIEDIFKIGSTAPAAMLYDALDHFEKRSPKADENIRSIKNELADAVNACINAAGHETTYSLQSTLLKAASFGKCFLDQYDPAFFVEMCKTLRLLNAVNHYEIGIPLTYEQYKLLTPEGLIDRLINRNQHLLAWRLCEYLKIKGDKVLVHWACAKVMSKNTMETDHNICETIVAKLAGVPGISYAEIAATAYRAGRSELATKLLDYEPRAADQVPLLISMKQDELALSKAIESGDTDLVYLVVLHIKKTRPQEFFRVIRSRPVALDLLISYCKQQDLRLLKDLFESLAQPQEIANILVMEAYDQFDMDKQVDRLKAALHYYQESKDPFAVKATEDQIKLSYLQKDLETAVGGKWQGLSMNDTIYQMIKVGQLKRAQKLKSDFKVPDRQYWWIRVKAHAHSSDWEGLEKFAKEKKSPIGYGPFVDVCLESSKPQGIREAEKYIPKIPEAPIRVNYWIRVGNFAEAIESAKAAKDPDLLMQIRNKCGNRQDVANHVDQLLHSFISK